jgi:predicted DNA-binding transcriptional regulator AlpA
MQTRVLRTPAAAKYLGMAESTLEKGRLTGTGPRFVRLGPRAVGYTVEDLDAHIDAGRRASTSDDGANPSDPVKPTPPVPAPSAQPRHDRAKRGTAAPAPRTCEAMAPPDRPAPPEPQLQRRRQSAAAANAVPANTAEGPAS